MNIKRPIKLFLFSIIIGIIILFGGIRLIDKLILVSVGLFLLLFLVLNKKIKLKVLLIVFAFVLLGSIRFYAEKSFYDKVNFNIEALNNKKQNITGIIYKKGKSTDSNYFILDDVKIYDTKFYRMRCYYNNDIYIDAKIGNKVHIEGYVNKNQSPMNIGQFDSETYYRSMGETGIIYANDIYVADKHYNIIRQNIYEIREIIINQIFKIFNKRNAGLFTAMLVGDKSYIDKDQRALFNDNGIAHILAISGLHLSILGLCLFELLRKRFSIKISGISVSIFVLLYTVFIDASVTTLRAVIMLYIRFLALGLGRSYDSKNVLFLTAIVFIILQPYIIFNSGFLFSYVAVYSLNMNYKFEFKAFVSLRKRILYLIDPYELKTIKKIHVIPHVIILTLFLFPITVFNYFKYPLYSLLLNLIVIPLMTLVLVFGVFGLLASFINLFCGKLLVGIVHFIFVLYEALCNYINTLPYHSLNIGRPSLTSIIVFYLVLFVIYYVMDWCAGAKFTKPAIFAILIIILIGSVFAMTYHHINGLNIEMLYIGQGDSLIIRDNDITVTIDGGSTTSKSNGKYILEPNIMAKAIDRIDIAFITHSDKDHTNCIEYLLKEGNIEIGILVLPIFAKNDHTYNDLKAMCDISKVPIQYMKQNDSIKISDELSFLCISPSENYKEVKNDVNNQSLVLKMNYKNKTALFTGDIGKDIEERLVYDRNVNSKLHADILKVAHHGSKNSSMNVFIDKVSPEYAIVSYGIGNKYGHPNEKVMERFDERNIKTYKTGESGEIDINIFNGSIIFDTYK